MVLGNGRDIVSKILFRKQLNEFHENYFGRNNSMNFTKNSVRQLNEFYEKFGEFALAPQRKSWEQLIELSRWKSVKIKELTELGV